jgi:transposase
MPTKRRPRPGDERAALEARRLQAAELFAQGHTQAEVAHQLGVSRQSAPVWQVRFEQGGVEALRSRGPTGPDPKLSPADWPASSRLSSEAPRPTGSTPT